MFKVSRMAYVASLLAAVVALSGCYSCRTHEKAKGNEVSDEVAKKFYWDEECVPLPKGVPPAVPATECGPYVVSRTYPTTRAGVVKLEKTMPDEVAINSQFDYTIRVTNMAEVAVDKVEVTEDTAGNFKFIESDPQGELRGNQLVWAIGPLEAGASREIKVTGTAITSDCIKQCSEVTYTIPACGFVKVVQPMLWLSKTAPSTKLLCDEIPLTFVVKNQGTGIASNVEISDELPADMETMDGQKSINIAVGALQPGESKEFTIKTRARNTGTFISKAHAKADNGLRSESDATQTIVTQPTLQISKIGPEREYLGRKVDYTITVTNTGDSPATNTILEDRVPAGVTNIIVSDGGRVEGDSVTWDLGTIGIDRSRNVMVSYIPARAGTFSSQATALATCAEGVTASVDTSIKGVPAILLEVVDLSDPIEVGQDETYLITVTNQGTEADTNILIKCFVEDNMKYISSSGATKEAFANGAITFEPVDVLDPGEKASWKVIVRATGVGDVRFKVTMNSDQLGRDVEETEASRFYK